ncbi:MAG TPA: hypothetical protein VFT93_02130 [Candidatus Eisenbacteria bacterium]|nr:hypothetical protein [Candidatus Eisenbacteria bacterium]
MTEAQSEKGSASSGDALPANGEVIEVRVSELRRLFNAIDPSPFHDRDLDPGAEEFIVNWAKEVSRSAELALRVTLERPKGAPEESAILRDSVHQFFARRAAGARRQLRELFGRGRTSLAIGLAFLAVSTGLVNALEDLTHGARLLAILREGLLIGGWVAMWRPLEVFLYDWWPIRAQARLYDRLARMPVRIQYVGEGAPDAWRLDWPAAPASAAGGPRPSRT